MERVTLVFCSILTHFLSNLQKDADKAAGDAAEIKKRFLAVQGQAIDAQAVAVATKREADKLREEAEKAELEMAAQASVKEQAKKEAEQQAAAPPPAPEAPPTPNANGHGGQEYLQQQQQQYGYGQPAAPPGGQPYPPAGNGYGQYPPPQQQYGYGAPAPYGGAMAPPAANYGFAPGVMGGASGDKGFDLPSPNQMQMPQQSQPSNDYANPYGISFLCRRQIRGYGWRRHGKLSLAGDRRRDRCPRRSASVGPFEPP